MKLTSHHLSYSHSIEYRTYFGISSPRSSDEGDIARLWIWIVDRCILFHEQLQRCVWNCSCMRILSNVLSGDNMLCYREGEFSHGANVGFCSSTTYSDFAIYSGVKLTNAHVNSYDSTPCFILRTTEYCTYLFARECNCGLSASQRRTVSQIGQFPSHDRPALGFLVPHGPNANLRSDPAVFANIHTALDTT